MKLLCSLLVCGACVLPVSACAQALPSILTADSLQHPGVPTGALSDVRTVTSHVYDGMVSEYRVYVPAQYDPAKPAALMVFQDGLGYAHRDGDHPALNVLDNLTAAGKIPVMIAVFTNPGSVEKAPGAPTYAAVKAYSEKWKRGMDDSMRSVEYDTVSGRYPRFVREELLPAALAGLNVRTDAYSHAITGMSSGGICAFNAAWQEPEQWSRVITWIGTFTGIQWHEDPAVQDGGQDYPDKVLREPHRNLRVWVQDGNNDQENERYGSWPLANLRMANALKLRGYDFRFSFGTGPHSGREGGAEFPDEMTWLWRGYDPAKTAETFAQDAVEASKPPFRVVIANR